ncbi:hypothetical protein C8R46DRAFT_484209 [Mycena filopes]|nr:hypothetical protein C8R46DRAFT_484209 [Mycena filopes]
MLESNSDLEAHLVAGSHSNDWLGHMILAVRTVSSGADFIPLPYVRAAFSTVLILLETVEKVKKNRDDLRDLCASTVEIVIILRYKSSMIGVELATLCEEFVAYLSVLRTGLEHLIKGRRGIGGRIKELLGAGNIASQIERYKTRVNELRSNFIVATISSGVAQLPAPPSLQTAFRRIALGDINLLYEAPMSSRVYQIKIYVARISGESSLKTVVKYENLHDEKWKQDLEVYSRFRHPHVWQLFGVSTAPGLQALIYHDELIPLAIYRRFHRPASNLVWVCVEAMLFKQFEDCSHHHHWLDGNREETRHEYASRWPVWRTRRMKTLTLT